MCYVQGKEEKLKKKKKERESGRGKTKHDRELVN